MWPNLHVTLRRAIPDSHARVSPAQKKGISPCGSIILGAVAALGLTACGSAGSANSNVATPPGAGSAAPTTAAATEPRTEAAVRAAATEEFDSYAAGDYGATWDLYYAPAKKAISRADYMRFFKLCPDLAGGVRFQIEKITMDSDHEAHVRVTRLIAVLTYQFVYESGHWRFVPTAESMRDYHTKTVEQVANERRAQGGCGK
jgi:hypothetical protein